jgi:hypothetical protein
MDFMGRIRGARVNSEDLSHFLCDEHNRAKKSVISRVTRVVGRVMVADAAQ